MVPLSSAAGAERQQDIGRVGGSGGAAGQPDAPQPEREQVQRHQHAGAAGGWSLMCRCAAVTDGM